MYTYNTFDYGIIRTHVWGGQEASVTVRPRKRGSKGVLGVNGKLRKTVSPVGLKSDATLD